MVLKKKVMQHDLYLKIEKIDNLHHNLCYRFDMSPEISLKLANILGCIKDSSITVPNEIPIYTKIEDGKESIKIETAFGIYFSDEKLKEVDEALSECGFDLYTEDREWS